MAADAFQKLKSSVNKGITTISVKTSSTLEKTKLKTHIESLSKDIVRDYSLIGEEAFKLWLNGNNNYDVLNAKFEVVKQKQNEIVELNRQLETIDERDSQILGTTASVNPVVQPGAAPRIICPSCGEQYDAPVKFCRKCGNPMQ